MEPSECPAAEDWQPGYLVWAPSVYVGAIGGTLAASALAPSVAPATAGWGLPILMRLVEADVAPVAATALSLALVFVLISVLPGLLSLFLIALTEVRLALHPVMGAAFLGGGSGWVTQSAGGAVFGAIFGFVSLGIIAGLLAAKRYHDTR